MKIVTAAQMRQLDRLTVERTGIGWDMLMETAGVRVVEAILETPGRRLFAVLCGKGNNGGDGAVIARHLWLRGAAVVDVFLLGRIDETKGEARTNFEIVRRLAESGATTGSGEISFREITDENEIDSTPLYHDVIVDALFGTGLARPAEGVYAAAIDAVNRAKNTLPNTVAVVAVDIPSGLPSDNGNIIGPNVRADLTVAFTAPKPGNVLPPASDAGGRLLVASIGTPSELIAETDSRLYLIEAEDIRHWLDATERPSDAHKGSVGDVLLIAGSRGKTGAAALAAEAVLRSGAGLVTVATARSAQDLLIAQARCEIMTEALDETPSGAVSAAAIDRAMELSDKRSVVAIGPGLSSSDESTREFVREMVSARAAPVILDADALNALAPWPPDLRGSSAYPVIITPHPGEMARLTGKSNAEVIADRVGVAREFAATHQVVAVLKGQRTVIAAPSGEVFINPTGNAGMATAGAGDVLTGMTAGFLAQSEHKEIEPAVDAVLAAVYLHGLAGDVAAETLGQRALMAGDITGHLPEALRRARERARE
ncbi:MAG: NAD(P)H-hydrate dehydratase [Acidobacteria bacterium]|nr:NAD(P)H-hydrate dehydratase [Acidobacteriota bacterium]MCW5968146.1 NAD(P)H-hydrate dehydratase [Blastocatellales bacterium]